MSDNTLINFGDLTKPATALIEKVSGACWLGYEPFHARRIAKAEIDIAKLKAEAALEISEIERRGLERLTKQAGLEQKNIESVTRIAIEHLEEDAAPDEIEDDWLSFFFDKARIVSDEQMQILWGKILAGEGNSQGSFSRRTIDFVSSLSKPEAELITKFASFCFFIGSNVNTLISINDRFREIFDTNLVNKLLHLKSIGIIADLRPDIGIRLNKSETPHTLSYFDNKVSLETPDRSYVFYKGGFSIPGIGQELIPIAGGKFNEDFWEVIISSIQQEEIKFAVALP